MMSGTLVSGTLASGTTSFSGMPISGTRSVRGRAPSPDPASAMTGIINTRVMPPAASEAGSEAALERITALENQVSRLQATVMEVLVKLHEVSSCVSTSSTPRRQAAIGPSPTTSNMTFEDLPDAPPPLDAATAVHLATREWVEGPKTPEQVASAVHAATQKWVDGPKMSELPAVSPVQVATRESAEGPKTPPTRAHTMKHPEGYRPVNCSCARSWSPEVDAVMPMLADAGVAANAFSVRGIASRGNLF